MEYAHAILARRHIGSGMSYKIIIDTDNVALVKRLFALHMKREDIDDYELSLLLFVLKRYAGSEYAVEFPGDRRSLRVRPRKSRYNININNAALLSATVVLDAFITSGVASAFLSASGRNLCVIAELSTETGALCNFIYLEQCGNGKFGKSACEIAVHTFGRKCLHSDFPCVRRHDGVCAITESDVAANLARMVQQAALHLDNLGRVTKLC